MHALPDDFYADAMDDIMDELDGALGSPLSKRAPLPKSLESHLEACKRRIDDRPEILRRTRSEESEAKPERSVPLRRIHSEVSKTQPKSSPPRYRRGPSPRKERYNEESKLPWYKIKEKLPKSLKADLEKVRSNIITRQASLQERMKKEVEAREKARNQGNQAAQAPSSMDSSAQSAKPAKTPEQLEWESSSFHKRNLGLQNTNIIFLDVDGVLHSLYAREGDFFNPGCMKRLKQIVDQTSAKIVLSTTWRRTKEQWDKVSNILLQHSIDAPIDKTRIGEDDLDRSDDILAFLAIHPVRKWIAIDDLPLHKLGAGHMWSNKVRGIDDALVRKAVKHLK